MALERLDPRTHDGLEALDHYARYVFASQFVAGQRTLDVACGVGYGAKILADAGASVVAIDHSDDAIAYAKLEYRHERIDYRCADAYTAGPELGGPFGVVVSFETIEHLEKPDLFLDRCRQLAHDETLFVLSVPNEAHLPRGFNPFHVQAFDRETFAALLSRHFPSFQIVPQYFSTASVIDWRSLPASRPMDRNPGFISRLHEIPSLPATYIALCGPPERLSASCSLVHGPRFHAHAATTMADLERARIWLSEQHQAWKQTAEERQVVLVELERDRAQAEEQRLAWMRTAEEQQAALVELERDRARAEEQRLTWMRTAEEGRAELARRDDELQQALTTLEMKERWAEQLVRVRDWLEEQRETPVLREPTRDSEASRLRAELDAIRNSRGYRLLEWLRVALFPRLAWRGRIARSLLREAFRLSRPNRR